jgi:predicted GNAT family acetyltransferase
MEIRHQNGTSDGAFLAVDGDRVIGEMTYVWSGNKHFIIDHTEVIDDYQGQGIGKKLVEKAVEFARKNNFTIYPQCSFAQQIFDENPEYGDVRKGY